MLKMQTSKDRIFRVNRRGLKDIKKVTLDCVLNQFKYGESMGLFEEAV